MLYLLNFNFLNYKIMENNQFEILLKEITKKYLIATDLKNKELNKKLEDYKFNLILKVNEKCFKEIKEYQDNLNLNYNFNKPLKDFIHLNLKDEKQNEKFALNLLKCSKEESSKFENINQIISTFSKFNNLSYSNCIIQCRKEDINNFSLIKTCLIDCYNLAQFNFRAYSNVIDNLI